MKLLIATFILLLASTSMAADKTIHCFKKSNILQTIDLAYDNPAFTIKTVTITDSTLEGDQIESVVMRPLGQILWQNFAFLIALPQGKSIIVPFAIFTQSPNSEIILDGSIIYKCK